jgi:conjugative transfer signal peptidase TraF
VLFGAVLAMCRLAVVGVEAAGFRIQHTESLPIGLYREVPGARPTKGAIGVWCLPVETARWAKERGYLGRGSCPGEAEPIGKVVLATANDSVSFSATGLSLNGHDLTATTLPAMDSRGRPIPRMPYRRYTIPPGHVWLWSPYTARSFDSRIFGSVPEAALVVMVRQVWTF